MIWKREKKNPKTKIFEFDLFPSRMIYCVTKIWCQCVLLLLLSLSYIFFVVEWKFSHNVPANARFTSVFGRESEITRERKRKKTTEIYYNTVTIIRNLKKYTQKQTHKYWIQLVAKSLSKLMCEWSQNQTKSTNIKISKNYVFIWLYFQSWQKFIWIFETWMKKKIRGKTNKNAWSDSDAISKKTLSMLPDQVGNTVYSNTLLSWML